MLKLRILVLTLFITSQSIYSQVNIQISVKQSFSKQAKLYLYQQSGSVLVDSSYQTSQGFFKFNLPVNYKQGLYKLTIGKNIYFDFIIAAEPQIIIETVVFAAEDSVKSILSKENEVYFQYKKLKKRLNQQSWYLNSLVDAYLDSASFRKQLQAEIYKVQTDLYNSSKNLAQNNPNIYSSNLILIEIKPLAPIKLSSIEKIAVMKKNWWNDANLKDNRFANSSALDSKVWGFIDLFYDDSLDKEQQDSSFITAVKTLMSLNADLSIKDFIRNILLKNYLETDYDAVTKYLYGTTFDGLSPIKLTDEEKNSYEILCRNGVGTKAKNFSFSIIDGTNQKFSKVISPYKLLIFWSMWCPHCTEMLPELYKAYLKFKLKGFEVIAVCIDDELEGWRKFISEKKYIWINALEPDNGESKILKEYNVDGTPKLFLVDKDLTIISRPSNVKQLEVKLKEVLH